jgi:NAD(P)-dependent dehydrogenase (short-subunit alcohol dehydrogenase family)
VKAELRNHVVIITGAANGIGRAIAYAAAQAGAQALFLTDIDRDGLNDTANDLSNEIEVHAYQGDLAKTSMPHTIASTALERFNRIDALVNAAGITTRASFIEGTTSQWESIFAINSRAPFFLMQETIQNLKKRNAPGAIVNIQSINAHCGAPDLAIYSASKGALQTLTKNAANAHLADRIRINGINLGWAHTEGEHYMQSQTLGKGDGWIEEAAKMRPLGRLISPEDAARMSVYLLSPASAPLTGVSIDLEYNVSGAPQ